jgi:TPP-dependent 2-oxoacid decarboxylase
VLITNRGHTIEAEIHDSLYNRIKNWDLAWLLEVFNAGEGKRFGLRAATVGKLVNAKERALAQRRTLPDRGPL